MVGHIDPAAKKKIARLGCRTRCPKHPTMDWAWLFDWPARFQVFSDRPDKEPHETPNLYGGALNGQSEITLHFAVVRSGHSRPAPFRFRFQAACSVR
jgi:hypothetical protein